MRMILQQLMKVASLRDDDWLDDMKKKYAALVFKCVQPEPEGRPTATYMSTCLRTNSTNPEYVKVQMG